MDDSGYPHATPEDEGGFELTLEQGVIDGSGIEDPGESASDYQWYEPGLFARLTVNKPLIILLVIAFLLLVIGPSLFYVLNPPRPRPPIPVRGQGIPALNTPAPDTAGRT